MTQGRESQVSAAPGCGRARGHGERHGRPPAPQCVFRSPSSTSALRPHLYSQRVSPSFSEPRKPRLHSVPAMGAHRQVRTPQGDTVKFFHLRRGSREAGGGDCPDVGLALNPSPTDAGPTRAVPFNHECGCHQHRD